MKKTFLAIPISVLVGLLSIQFSLAQIIINNGDMPSVNDMIVVNSVTPSASIDPVPTGANFNWDFSGITSTSQSTDTFISVLSIPSIYSLAFISSSYGVRSAQNITLGTITFSDIYNIYKNSSSKYEYSGQGAEINSIPTPMVYSPKDLVYKFPLNYGNADSSTSGFTITIPTLGEYSKFRKRVNVVDGWGMLSIPSGNFNVLRVKSTITDRDSFAITGIPIPIVIPSTTIEYKWLGKLQGEPLLQINANQFAVTQVLYLENPVLGINNADGINSAFTVFPNPSTDALNLIINAASGKTTAGIFTATGEKISEIEIATGEKQTSISVGHLAEGIYFLRISSEENIAYKKFVVLK